MRIEFLGTAGAIPTPRPGCQCRLCELARQQGIPYARCGPCVFVHGPDLLIDTPEEVRLLLERAGIGEIAAGLYSHWHPDHTAGRRVWETRNADFRRWPPRPRPTPIYLPQQVAEDFQHRQGLGEAFAYMAEKGWVTLHTIPEQGSIVINGVLIQPVQLADPSVYAFLLSEGDRKVLIAMDELVGWEPPSWLCQLRLDLAVLPVGVFEFDPFSGQRRIPADHVVLTFEATWRQTLVMARRLGARHTVFTHIEEADGNTPEDLARLQEQLRAEGLQVTFAWDGYAVEVT